MFQDIIFIRHLGLKNYKYIFDAMQNFTNRRNGTTPDEIWLVEHFPVFTQGKLGKKEHLLFPGEIPVIQCDRGGQVTYHGPGQQVMYVLFDLRRRKLSARDLIILLKKVIISTLSTFGIRSDFRVDAPGIYVEEKKICSIGLAIRKGCSFHGLALNVAMDLTPFLRINPCGHVGIRMTHMLHWVNNATTATTRYHLITQFLRLLQNPQYEYIDS